MIHASTDLERRTIMPGTLYLCATPIGNLEDITLRVLRILKEADLIAAEDTRNSIKLLNHFDIHTPLTSYHEFNKVEKAHELVGQLLSGKNIALITDAGTPGISDPGEVLVRFAREQGISVTSLPGAAAAITALSGSGQSTRRFAFEGFLPREKKERREILSSLSTETRTIIVYEAPHHLCDTLKDLYEALGDRNLSVCRELTKKHEEYLSLTLTGAIHRCEETDPRGEYVLVIEGKDPRELIRQKQEKYESISIKEHVDSYESLGMDRKEAMKAVAKDRGIGKREVYEALLKND